MARNEKGHWLPGTSGNPGGNGRGAAGLARKIMRDTSDLNRVVEVMLGVLEGKPMPGTGVLPDPSLQVDAAKWLADRAVGKAAQVIDISVEGAEDTAAMFRDLTPEQFVALGQILRGEGNDDDDRVPAPPASQH